MPISSAMMAGKILIYSLLLVLSFARSAQAQTPAPAPGCTEFKTSEPPFYISSPVGNGTKNWENFQSSPNIKSTVGFLPKNSIVRLSPEAKDMAVKSGKTTFVPVEVISVPDSNVYQTAKNARQPLKNNILGKLEKAKPGDKGYVAQGNLAHVNGYTFMIREDAPILAMSEQFKLLAGRALRLAHSPDGKFAARQCCEKTASGLKCEVRYVFEILAKDMKTAESVMAFNPTECDFCLNFLRPILDTQIEPIRDILSMTAPGTGKGVLGLELVDSMGIVKIPVDPQTGAGPFGSLHYSPEKGYEVADDAFADLTTACTFMRFLESHQKRCKVPGCQIQWGDAYYPFLKNGKKEHKSHDDGQCIDIRPLRSNDDDKPIYWSKGKSTDYDLNKTKDLIEHLKAAGGDPILFNDKRTGANRWPGHDNHIHVCFDPESPRVQEVCKQGLSPKK